MRSLNDKLKSVRDSIKSVIGQSHVYHYFRPINEKPPFAVWMEDGGENSMSADNKKAEQVVRFTVDYYTLEEFDSNIDNIQSLLNDKYAWKLVSVVYEDDTNLINYTWEVWA